MRVQVLSVGDNVVDRYPERNVMYPGGNAVNVAVHARRCGVGTGYVGAVGTDEAGNTVLDALVAEGVDTSLLRVVEGPNAFAVVRLVEGNRVFGPGDEGVSRFRLSGNDLEAASKADVVHTGECSMLEEQMAELAQAARLLSFDFSERPWEYVQRLAPLVGVAIRSSPSSSLDVAVQELHRMRSLGPPVAAVTLGAGGAVVSSGEDVVHAPAATSTVVDTLGAGDAFIGRLLAGLVTGEPLVHLTRAATAYASAACTSFGAFGYPTATQDSSAPLDPIQHGGVEPR